MRTLRLVSFASSTLLFAACGGSSGAPGAPLSGDAGLPPDSGTPDAGPDAGADSGVPNGTFAQYFGQPDNVTTGCGIAGISDQHFTSCALYAGSGYTQVDAAGWSLSSDATGTDVPSFWDWAIGPTSAATTEIGPVWAGVAQAPDGVTAVGVTYGGGLEIGTYSHPDSIVGSLVSTVAADSSGITGNARLGGATGAVSLTSIVTTSEGEIVVAGQYQGDQTFGMLTPSTTDPHPFVMGLSGTLTPDWFADVAQAGQTGEIETLARAMDGGVIAGGWISLDGGSSEPVLVALDRTGGVEWQRALDTVAGQVTHVANDGARWFASVEGSGPLAWGSDAGLQTDGGAVLISGEGQSEQWAWTSDVPLTALAAGNGRLVAIGAALGPAKVGDTSVDMPPGLPSVFVEGLDPATGASKWVRVYTSGALPFVFSGATVLPSNRLLISGTQRVPTDFGVGWKPGDQGQPTGLWLVLSPLP